MEDQNTAKQFILNLSQKESFADVYDKKAKGQQLSASNQLNKRSPFRDKNGLLRLRGRLKNADSCYEAKHLVNLSAYIKSLRS